MTSDVGLLRLDFVLDFAPAPQMDMVLVIVWADEISINGALLPANLLPVLARQCLEICTNILCEP